MIRRAPAILIAAALAVAVMAALAAPGALARLAEARAALATAEERAGRPLRPVHLLARDRMIVAPDAAAAHAVLIAELRRRGARGGVLVERVTAEPVRADAPRLVALRLSASGRPQAMLRFVAATEQARPSLRFAEWQLASVEDGAGSLRLEARLLALWQPAP